MKARILVVVLILISTASGIWLGTYFTGRSWAKYFITVCVMQESNEANTTVRALRMIRAGKQNEAIDLLEGLLDDSLITFMMNPMGQNVTNHPDYVIRTVAMARDYRSKFPYQSGNPEITSAVQKVLEIKK